MQIGEESILIAVSSPHRRAAWKAGEEALEEVKAKVEIWKEEWFEDGGVWRSNRDGEQGVPVVKLGQKETKGSGILPVRRKSEVEGGNAASAARRGSQAEGSANASTARRSSEAKRLVGLCVLVDGWKANVCVTSSRRKSVTSGPAPVKRAPTGEFTEGGFEV